MKARRRRGRCARRYCRAMGVRLEPADEYTHELGPEPSFNESMYVNVFDPEHAHRRLLPHRQPGQRGLRRDDGVPVPARRPGRLHVQAPDDRPQRRPRRRRAHVGRGHAVRGAAVRYEGQVVLLDDPTEMADPKAAFTTNPYAECAVDLTFTGQGARLDVRRRARPAPRGPGRGVRQGPLRAAGRGPRHDPGRRRGVGSRGVRAARPLVGAPLLAGALVLPLADRQRRLRLRLHGQPGGPARRRRAPAAASCGRTAQLHLCDDVELATEYEGDDRYHRAIRGTLRSSRSGREWTFAGSVMNLIPLRNRRQDPDGNHARHPHQRGPHRVDHCPTAARATGCRSTSTRSSTAQPVGLAE